MGHQTQDQIDHILDRVHSLDDLSAEDIMELRCLSEQSIIMDKFKVSPAQYYDWLDKISDGIRGVEYDAQNACIILKGGPGWMREAATGILYELLLPLRDRMSAATGSLYFLTGSKNCLLTGKSCRSSKQADASLMNFKAKWPVVVLEVGISETTTKLYDDAKRWLKGSNR
ncbi:hypothetical protein TSTA_042000 [Talaromyces stipitatus ATCC 10500]|uniref:Uncharacterized protein n=1 Tax=Talaromyces stipitatus (strain ATCC 10500 / CBS 375.48 / QM 6759 / NRRL 1006) TaxID=441959 RepID=B8MJD6_TALSN|nr:uncharacterized protein TSTA_042000 [Talaromyces stipitatus ATCC 10500]EED14725.1 hypothetical protein TSTA_042000 [Talaromyces stipitatus ATCC 10500]